MVCVIRIQLVPQQCKISMFVSKKTINNSVMSLSSTVLTSLVSLSINQSINQSASARPQHRCSSHPCLSCMSSVQKHSAGPHLSSGCPHTSLLVILSLSDRALAPIGSPWQLVVQSGISPQGVHIRSSWSSSPSLTMCWLPQDHLASWQFRVADTTAC